MSASLNLPGWEWLAPFRVPAPALVSFSGGRSSAMMGKSILDAYNGQLPEGVHFVFANTGKERAETLDFVQECADRWGVPITWVEWRDNEAGFEVVNHNSASRGGEPYDALIAKKGYLPNQVTRYCTTELKIRPMKKYMESIGIGRGELTTVIGYRADEESRVIGAKARCASRKDAWLAVAFPLYTAGIVKPEVRAYWRQQSFDLRLEDHEGNCDLCFLKARAKIRHIMFDRPDLAPWWIEKEAEQDATFRAPGRPTYAQLFETRRKQESFDFPEDPLDFCMGCTD